MREYLTRESQAKESKPAPLALERLADLIPVIGQETFERIKGYLTLEPRRPHVIEYAARQRRFRELLKPENRVLLDALQEDIDTAIEFLLEQDKKDEPLFSQLDRELFQPDLPSPYQLEPFRYKSPQEAGDKLVSKPIVTLSPEIEEGIARIKAALGKRVIEVRFHGRGGQGAVSAARLLATYFGEAKDLGVQACPKFGVERRGAPVSAYFREGAEEIKDHSAIQQPDIVVILITDCP